MSRFAWIKSILSFSKSETRGLIVLFVIMLVLLIIRSVMYRKLNRYDLVSYLSADTNAIIESGNNSNYFLNSESHDRITNLSSQPLDPNKATFNELVFLGVPSNVARNLIKFREHGAVYQSAHDLLKIYGFDSLLFKTLKDKFIFSGTNEYSGVNLKTAERFMQIELNRSDSILLMRLPGIGPVLSVRILKYRNLLGGFYSPVQLTEVYGINDSLVKVLYKYVEIDTSLIRKLNINVLSVDELEHHPYISEYQAKAIESYRRLIGPFISVNQLVKNYLIPEETYYRLLPYLEIK